MLQLPPFLVGKIVKLFQALRAKGLAAHGLKYRVSPICICPTCHKPIPKGLVDSEKDEAFCPKCKTTYSVNSIIVKLDPFILRAPPVRSEIQMKHSGDEVVILLPQPHRRLRRVLRTLAILLLWSPILYACICFCGFKLSKGTMSNLEAILWGVGALALYAALCRGSVVFLALYRRRHCTIITMQPATLQVVKQKSDQGLEWNIPYSDIRRVFVGELKPHHPARIASLLDDPLEDPDDFFPPEALITTPVIEHLNGFVHVGESLSRDEMDWLVDTIERVVKAKTGQRV